MKKYLITVLLALLLFTLAACGENGNVQGIPNHQTINSDENAPVSQYTENNLSDLRTPYIGAAHAVWAIVNVLPLPTSDWSPDVPWWNVSSIEIGQDFGDFSESHAPYTLMIIYDAAEGFFTTTTQQTLYDASHIFEENTELLFELIENLQAVTFALNIPIWSEDDDFPIHEYRWSRSRSGVISIISPPIEETLNLSLPSLAEKVVPIGNTFVAAGDGYIYVIKEDAGLWRISQSSEPTYILDNAVSVWSAWATWGGFVHRTDGSLWLWEDSGSAPHLFLEDVAYFDGRRTCYDLGKSGRRNKWSAPLGFGL